MKHKSLHQVPWPAAYARAAKPAVLQQVFPSIAISCSHASCIHEGRLKFCPSRPNATHCADVKSIGAMNAFCIRGSFAFLGHRILDALEPIVGFVHLNVLS